jgi:uncharacterized repeat protein (TIGR03943 family)
VTARLSSLLALATGVLLLRLVAAHSYTAYVKPSAGVLLMLAGVVLVSAGGLGLVSGNQEHRPPRVALLLLAPLGLLVLVSPPSLGAAYARHSGPVSVVGRPGDRAPLHPGADGTTSLSLAETVRRAVIGDSLSGQQLRLVGFSAGRDAQGRLLLTRFGVRCCAADAFPYQVAVTTDETLADDTWVEVVGTITAVQGPLPVLQPTRLTKVDEPEDPYES